MSAGNVVKWVIVGVVVVAAFLFAVSELRGAGILSSNPDLLDEVARLEQELRFAERDRDVAQDRADSLEGAVGAEVPSGFIVIMLLACCGLAAAVVFGGRGVANGIVDREQAKKEAARILEAEVGWVFYRRAHPGYGRVWRRCRFHSCQVVSGVNAGLWGVVEFVQDTYLGRPVPGMAKCVLLKLDDASSQSSVFDGSHVEARDFLLRSSFQKSVSSKSLKDLFEGADEIVSTVENLEKLNAITSGGGE